ncbi:PEP-CTERM protein-sorting domain-containing protein [Terrimicrobium sacchariphilum]|uniref:PEP-CTERM protein-sorting domain-containing protein n=1 Tax=Terrimicrobium sacchariphilum TaxID=690879 RepID=A0A146GCL3_TERSA|nr:PEP-CTERM protein-sorting domain-containing protein [Terrimicrobium sacchariphilum]
MINNEGKKTKMTHTLPNASRGKKGGYLTRLLAIAAIAGGSTGSLKAANYTWDGGTGNIAWSSTDNWVNNSITFDANSIIYFSAPGTIYNTVQIDKLKTVGALVFGTETSGSGGVSIIGNNNAITISTVLGSSLGLTGDLASANIGLWVQSGAGVNGLYANNTSSNTASKNQVGVPVMIATANTTFVNESGSDFCLDARLRGTTGGSLILNKGSWVIDYSDFNSGNGTSQMNGGLTIEDAKLTLNVAGGTHGTNSTSPLGEGALNLGLAGSSKDAVFIFTSLERASGSDSNRLTPSSKNLVNVADGTGKRVIQNGSAVKKELYSALTIEGSATLTLDNNNIDGAVIEISADGSGVGNPDLDTKTGVRGTGNLYLTGGGTFYTKAGVVIAGNGVRNSFTGQTTVHQGTLQFIESGGFQKSSVIQVDKQGILDVSQAAGGAYTVGDGTYLSGSETQTLSGTGHVVGTLLLGTQSVLRAGGTDAGSYRAALSFDSDLSLGPLTVADLSGVYYGAVDTAAVLSYAGELRVTLAQGFYADGIYDLFGFGTEAGDFTAITVYSGATLLGSLSQGVGEFATLWTGSIAGQDYSFDQLSGDLAVSAIPEPHTMVLLGLAAFLLIANKRRFLRL